MIVELPSLRRTRSLAARVAGVLEGGELLLLSGDLGAGKTTFVGYLAKALGVPDGWVSSPSFTLVQTYPPGKAGFGITHVDLYRLASENDLESLGLEEIMASEDLVVVEWPQAGAGVWRRSGRPILRMRFIYGPDVVRSVELDFDLRG
jgi:tRNA threonylcarbamoyladenosine biosynthesis protein TsaE